MTNKTPSPGNAPGLPEHLDAMQGKAMLAHSLVECINGCVTKPDQEKLLHTLLDALYDLIGEINTGLDFARLPKGSIQ